MMNVKLLQSCTMLSVLVLVPVAGFALPSGEVVNSGNVAFDRGTANTLNINQSTNKAIISWDSFNISTGETTNFNQPNAGSVTLNRIGDANPTRIFGTMHANGNVMLINKNGFQFGPTSKVDVGGMIATTSGITDDNFNNSTGNYKFNQPATDRLHATITVNNGAKINTLADGGVIALVAPNVVNQGTINAHLGKVSLAGGQAFTIDLMGDGLVNLQVPTTNTDAKVTNDSTGKIIADGGAVKMSAKTASSVVDSLINLDGIVQAQTVSNQGGRIILDANKAVEAASLHTDADTVELRNDKLKVDKDGIALVNTNGTVKLGKGTFTTDHTIQVNKSVTLQGSGVNNTNIDTTGTPNGAFGIHVTADNAEIRALNVKSGTNNQNAIKVEGDYTTHTKVNGVKIVNVTVDGHSKRAEIDLNGADNAVVRNVTVNGNNTDGVGIAVTDSNRVTIQNVNTSGNNWGGIGIYTSGNSFAGGVDKLKVLGNNTFGEANQLYTEENNGFAVTRLTMPGFDYLVQSTALSNAHQKLYQMTVDGAVALALGSGADATVQGLDEASGWTAGNNTWWVGRDATRQMDLQSSFNAVQDNGTLNILAGNYDYNSTLYVTKDGVTVRGAGRDATTLTDHGVDYGMLINGDDATLKGFTLQSANAATSYGLKIEPDTLASANPAADDSDGHMEDPRYQDTVSGLTLDGLRVKGFGKNEIDLHSARNALINDVIADGAGTGGYGIALTDSRDVTLNGVHTKNNGWGGLYFDARGKYYVGGVDGIRLTGTNKIDELNQLTVQEENGYTATNLYLPMFDYVARAGVAPGISLYQENLDPAVTLALGLGGAGSTVEGLRETGGHTVGNNHFYVGQQGGQEMSIQTAADTAQDGGTVEVLDGTYHLNTYPNHYLYLTKSVALVGQGEGDTVLDGSANATYGIRIQSDNVALADFTLIGPHVQAAGSSQEYGIKAELGAGTGGNGKIDNLLFTNLTVRDAGKSQIDVNSGDTMIFNDVTLTGRGTRGAGLFLTDDSNVLINNVTASNNAWGDVALSANAGDMQNILFTGGNDFGSAIQMYTEGANGHTVSNIYAPMFKYVTAVNGVAGYGAYYTALTPAITRAVALSTANATVQGLKTPFLGWTRGNNTWYVGETGTALSQQMSIQAAVDAASTGGLINIQDGTYNLDTYPFHYLYVNKALTLNGNGRGNTLLDGSANSSYGIRVLADNVTLQNFTLTGPHIQSTGSSQEYGVKAEVVDSALSGPTIDHFTMNNVTVQGAGKTQVDVNTATFAAFNNVTANGNGVRGNGFGITDAHDVTFNNVTASGNAWGDIRLTAKNADTDKVRLTGSNHLNDPFMMYTEQYAGNTVHDIYFPTMKFTLHSLMNDGNQGNLQTYYTTTEAKAISLADDFVANGATDVVVQGNKLDSHSHNIGNNVFYVDGNMDIVSALAEAQTGGLVHLYNATYTVASPLDLGGKTIAFVGTGEMPEADGGTVIDASTLTDAFSNGSESHSDLLLLLAGGGSGGNGGNPDDLMVRETTRRNSGFAGGSGGIGGGDAFSLIEPAAGEGSSNEKKDIADSPLQQQDLAVAQYFINTGQVVDQQYAVQALLADAALNGK